MLLPCHTNQGIESLLFKGIFAPKTHLSNVLPDLYPDPHDVPQGWGLTFFLHLRDSAVHSEGTGWWAGLPNLFWWADRKRVSSTKPRDQKLPGPPYLAL